MQQRLGLGRRAGQWGLRMPAVPRWTAPLEAHLLAERDLVRARLQGAGAVVLDAPADDLLTRCVAAYLRLKSTARL